MRSAILLGMCTLLVLCQMIYLAGCAKKGAAPTTQPATASERSDRALKDPFHYSPGWDDADTGHSGTADLDRRGLQKDLEHVFMP